MPRRVFGVLKPSFSFLSAACLVVTNVDRLRNVVRRILFCSTTVSFGREPYPVQSPYLAVANKNADTMIRISSEFSFTPANCDRIFSFKLKNSLPLDDVSESDDEIAGLRIRRTRISNHWR
jgi:hypothetical protein